MNGTKTNMPIVIAHRGASAYLPEHTLASKAVAHAMGADYIEQDIVLSRDGVPIVLHDIYLDSTTDVAQRFPRKARADGRFYALDFKLEEINQLRVRERSQPGQNQHVSAVYPDRFTPQTYLFGVPTLAQEIDLIAGMDRSRGRTTGLYIEFKAPNWHRSQGYDPVTPVMSVLAEKGYADKEQQVYLQCFDDSTLRQLRQELDTPLPLIQLIGDNSWGEDGGIDFDYLRSARGLAGVAEYAAGIGPWVEQIFLGRDDSGKVRISELTELARNVGLLVHPYTLRSDDLPEGVANLEELVEILVTDAKVDGLFTDFPDRVRDHLLQLSMSQ